MFAVNHHIYEEANKVVDQLIENVIEISSDEEESIEDVEKVSLDETCGAQEKKHPEEISKQM